MHLSVFSDYSLRVLMYGAIKETPFQLDEVTTAYGISRHHLGKVVHNLARLGYLETRRGRGGGIRLAKGPEEIRIGVLVRMCEDQPVIVECFDPETNRCRIAGSCKLKGVLAAAMNAFYATLDKYTLRDLVSGGQRPAMADILLRGANLPQPEPRPRAAAVPAKRGAPPGDA